MNIVLTRDPGPNPDYTYGVLQVGTLALQTIERPWVPDPGGAPHGERGMSCVPSGEYALVTHDTVTHPHTWALVNTDLGIYHEPSDVPPGVSGRSACLIHAGNLANQSEGCILVGLTRAQLNGQPDVAASQAALTQLKAVLPWRPGNTLLIT